MGPVRRARPPFIQAAAACVFLACACVSSAVAQTADPSGPPLSQLPRPVANAVKIDEALTIDGRLDEGMWQSSPPLSGFLQAEPFQGPLAVIKLAPKPLL